MEFLPWVRSMEFLASLSAKELTQLSFDEGLVKWRFIIFSFQAAKVSSS